MLTDCGNEVVLIVCLLSVATVHLVGEVKWKETQRELKVNSFSKATSF